MHDQECRYSGGGIQVRASGDGSPGTASGYAALYNVETVIGGWWREQIAPGAFAGALESGADVRALWNHDTGAVLGRTVSGTLALASDAKGLRYDIALPPTQLGQDVKALIQRGDVTGSSFGFRVIDEEVDSEPTKRGLLPLVTITAVELYEVSPVTFPAYEETSVSMRRRSKVQEGTDRAAAIAVRHRIRTRIRLEAMR